jgi:putative ABC transport system ATP-binding protein
MIRVSGLSKVYRSGDEEVEALRGVSFEVSSAACLFIVGPSGSGKSSLLHLIAALDTPTAGTIVVDGENLTAMSEDELNAFRRRKCGLIFQQFNLIANLTAVDNVLMPFIPIGVTPELHAKAEALLRRVGLADRMGHRPSRLSGGQQQRVAIARALLKNPAVLLADEPTGNLDRKSADEVFELLRADQQEIGRSLIVVTHDRRFIRPGDRVIEIQDGLIADSTSE